MELLQKLGVDWRLLIAQLLNFLILMIILWRFLYKPVLNVLEKRREKIEKGLKDAEKIGAELERIKAAREKEIKKAKQEAKQLLEEAEARGETLGQEMKQRARDEVEKLINAAKMQMMNEKEKMMTEAKQEISSLVIAATEKVLGKAIDARVNQKLIEESLKEINFSTKSYENSRENVRKN